MRKWIIAVLAAVLLTVGLVSATAPVSKASGATVALCWVSGFKDQCMNAWNGPTPGHQVKFYAYGNGSTVNNGWVPVEIGTVQYNSTECGGNWPFINGSGMNYRYRGSVVFQMQQAQARALSLWSEYDTSVHQGPEELELTDDGGGNLCNVAHAELFVGSSASYLVDVFATNAEFVAGDPSYVPTFVGWTPNGTTDNGQPVISNDQAYAPWLQNSPQAP